MFPIFTEDQTAIREAARAFALAEIEPGAMARDASGEFPKDILKQLGDMGFMGMTVPEAYGGAGVDFLSYILFDSRYCRELIELGIQDALREEEKLRKFFGEP